MASFEDNLTLIKSWFDGENLAEIRFPQSTFVEFEITGQCVKIHYENSIARSRGIGRSFSSFEITKKHTLCSLYNGPFSEIKFHEGPNDGSELLAELNQLVTGSFEYWAGLEDFINPYFLVPGNLKKNTSGDLGSAPAAFSDKISPVLKKSGMKFKMSESPAAKRSYSVLLMDSMYVVAEGFRLEILKT